jgi:hypothetical protein
MTMQENYKDEWLDRAFRLAYFLHGRRETALAIAARAMNKLETASNAQFKRFYYTPQGRADSAKATRSRVSLSDLQLLQRLVFVESEIFERQREAAGKTCEESLLKFFIKHLIRISLKRNSFYVTLAVTRILHNYATADAMEIYNVVVQDPERVHDDYYYRSRKGVLMKELKERFGSLLETVKVNRGEERFSAKNGAEDLTETARDALKFFTPWKSACALPEKFDPFADILKPFHFDKNDPDEEHRIEINRIHAAIHPCCFERLTTALNLPVPDQKMEIPNFMTNTNQNHLDNDDWRDPPSLKEDELRQIKEILTAQAESRKALSAGFLRVTADGAERARINLAETDSANFDLDESAELIEIYGAGKRGETLLATHLLNFDELENGNQTQTIMLEGGQKITFHLAPTLDRFGEVSEVKFNVQYAETAWQKRFALTLRRAKFAAGNLFGQPILKPVAAFGLILLAVAVGWIVFRNFGENETVIVDRQPTPNPVNEANVFQTPTPDEKNEIADQNALKNSRDENKNVPRSFEKHEPPPNQTPKREIKKQTAPKPDKLIAPPQKEMATNKTVPRKNETDENGVLRLPIRENNRPEFERREREGLTRNPTKKFPGKSLAEIRSIYVEISGDEVLGKEIAEKISAELGASSRFQVTNDKDQADAALKIYVRHESDGDTRADASVAAIVRLVNEKGFVVYPNRRGVSGWKYVGTMAKLPARIAADLARK